MSADDEAIRSAWTQVITRFGEQATAMGAGPDSAGQQGAREGIAELAAAFRVDLRAAGTPQIIDMVCALFWATLPEGLRAQGYKNAAPTAQSLVIHHALVLRLLSGYEESESTDSANGEGDPTNGKTGEAQDDSG